MSVKMTTENGLPTKHRELRRKTMVLKLHNILINGVLVS